MTPMQKPFAVTIRLIGFGATTAEQKRSEEAARKIVAALPADQSSKIEIDSCAGLAREPRIEVDYHDLAHSGSVSKKLIEPLVETLNEELWLGTREQGVTIIYTFRDRDAEADEAQKPA